jgi:monoamine oxidase
MINNQIGIIGGGITGLYLAYHLSKKQIPCTLFEATNRLGGRIHTYEDPHLGEIEAGAGRFLLSHKYLVRLLKELDLYDKKYRISGHWDYKPSSGSPLYQVLHSQKKGHIEDLIQKVIRASRRASADSLRKTVFIDFIRQVLKVEESQYLYDSFGYSTELTVMNAYDACKMVENQLINRYYYILRGGMEQIIHRLIEVLDKSVYVTIRRRCPIENISPLLSGGYRLTTTKGLTADFTVCICAVPVPVLRQWPIFSPIKSVLDTIICAPLCRIYSIVEGVGSQLPHKFSTNTDIRYYIPIRGDIAMVSYTDNEYARRWNRIYEEKGIQVLNRALKTELEKTVGPTEHGFQKTKVFYWECGVGYWGPGADSVNFDQEPQKGLFICGENISQNNQQWIEGALDTAEEVLKKVK